MPLRSSLSVSCPFKIFFPFVFTVLIFSIAGLLFFVPRARRTWELNASRGRPAFSSQSGKRGNRRSTYWPERSGEGLERVVGIISSDAQWRGEGLAERLTFVEPQRARTRGL